MWTDIKFFSISNCYPSDTINHLPRKPTEEHPLKPSKAISIVNKTKKAQLVPELDGFDPLSQLAAEAELVSLFSFYKFTC